MCKPLARFATLALAIALPCGAGCGNDETGGAPTAEVKLQLVTCNPSYDQIRACVSPDGSLRIMSGTQKCSSQEKPLCWSQVGPAGTNSLSTITALPVGDAHCAMGGSLLSVGSDANRNGRLDPAEISGSTYVCNGATGAPGPQGSPGESGTSCSVADNGDGTKTIACQDGTTATVTDGAPGAPGAEGASCSVTVQPDGTKLIVCGLTSAVVSDGAAGPTGPAGPQGASGAPGLNSLIRMTVEPPGPNCPAGGQKLETGLDANSNGVLDPNEVNVAATAYLCTPVACAPLYSPDNGSVAVPSLSCGATATYSCSAGFLLVGPATRTCQADGSWTDVEPSCECDGMMCNGRCANTRTDNDNCGGCDVVCNAAPPSTAQCAAGRCLSSLALGQCPYAVAVDASNLYWTDLIGNTVMKIGISGGTPVMLASGQSNPQELAVDATSVYWTNYDGGTVMKVALTGGTPTVLASGQSNPKGIAVDGTNVYWANYGGGTVMKVPLAGGEAVTLASDQLNPKGIAVDANSVYWTNNGGGYQGGSVVKMPLAGGVMTTLASGETRPEAIAVDADYVHWTLYLGNVFHTPLSGGPITTWFGGSLPLALHIAVDEAHTVYWTTEGTGTAGSLLGTVMRVGPNSSGSPTTLISGQWAAEGIAIDATAVYWARCGTESNGYAGALMKLSPR